MTVATTAKIPMAALELADGVKQGFGLFVLVTWVVLELRGTAMVSCSCQAVPGAVFLHMSRAGDRSWTDLQCSFGGKFLRAQVRANFFILPHNNMRLFIIKYAYFAA